MSSELFRIARRLLRWLAPLTKMRSIFSSVKGLRESVCMLE